MSSLIVFVFCFAWLLCKFIIIILHSIIGICLINVYVSFNEYITWLIPFWLHLSISLLFPIQSHSNVFFHYSFLERKTQLYVVWRWELCFVSLRFCTQKWLHMPIVAQWRATIQTFVQKMHYPFLVVWAKSLR